MSRMAGAVESSITDYKIKLYRENNTTDIDYTTRVESVTTRVESVTVSWSHFICTIWSVEGYTGSFSRYLFASS